MVDIAPFKGVLFNQKKTGPISQITAPPYDVISLEQQDKLYTKNPYNVVRLILEKEYPEDDEKKIDTHVQLRHLRGGLKMVFWLKIISLAFMFIVKNIFMRVSQFVELGFSLVLD